MYNTGSIPPPGPLSYEGQVVVPFIRKTFNPQSSFNQFPVPTIWINSANDSAFILVSKELGVAVWLPFSGSVLGAILTLSDTSGTTVDPDMTGNIQLEGTTGQVIITADALNNKLVFSLAGNNPPATSIGVDASTPPGTNPVLMTSTGLITITGDRISTNTITTGIRTNSTAANAFKIEVQEAGSNASTASSTKYGVAQFDANQFNVVNGFVQLLGGGTSPAVTKIDVQANTSPGTDPVVASATGTIAVNGAAVAAHSVPIETRSRAANAYNIEVQYASAVSSTDATKSGICHFDSTAFAVDANGFVTSIATAGALVWQKISANQTLQVNHGYICISPGGSLSLALPSTSSFGQIIEVTLDGATSFTITQGAGQQIRIGNQQTTSGAGGSLTSTAQGDTLRLICQTDNLKWNVLSGWGSLTVV
jgi:hypothetical protein